LANIRESGVLREPPQIRQQHFSSFFFLYISLASKATTHRLRISHFSAGEAPLLEKNAIQADFCGMSGHELAHVLNFSRSKVTWPFCY
jgi:hypothetical protein